MKLHFPLVEIETLAADYDCFVLLDCTNGFQHIKLKRKNSKYLQHHGVDIIFRDSLLTDPQHPKYSKKSQSKMLE